MGLLLAMPSLAFSADSTSEALLKELQALKARVTDLEQKLDKAQSDAATAREDAMKARETSGHSLKVSQELSRTKGKETEGILSEAGKRLKLYGAVEVEANWGRMKRSGGGEDSDESDITLATAELFVEAAINKYVTGVIHFLWEEGSTEPVDIDEAFILLGQTDDVPWYLMAGRIYPAVGLFESYFISDPLTQELFETQDSAVEAGYSTDWINVGAGIFNSDVHEFGDDPDNMINTYYARLQLSLPEETVPGLSLTGGVAYINNIAASGFLSEQVPDERLDSLVGGMSVMGAASYNIFSLTAEYITALDEFNAGELDYAGDHKAKPWALDVELAATPWDEWTFAVRYTKADDVFEEFPESVWGAVASWEFLPDTVLSLEYQHGDYTNDDEADTITSQLAIAF
ncbi:MAG: LbtU family siderophore porin [Deltaproteobacteria bacterium]|nr:LbtU family siderophore porin [Deltaproteobacteria bacterium]